MRFVYISDSITTLFLALFTAKSGCKLAGDICLEMKRGTRKKDAKGGFTLAELLIEIAIIAIVATAVIRFTQENVKITRWNDGAVIANQAAISGLEDIKREMMNITHFTSTVDSINLNGGTFSETLPPVTIREITITRNVTYTAAGNAVNGVQARITAQWNDMTSTARMVELGVLVPKPS